MERSTPFSSVIFQYAILFMIGSHIRIMQDDFFVVSRKRYFHPMVTLKQQQSSQHSYCSYCILINFQSNILFSLPSPYCRPFCHLAFPVFACLPHSFCALDLLPLSCASFSMNVFSAMYIHYACLRFGMQFKKSLLMRIRCLRDINDYFVYCGNVFVFMEVHRLHSYSLYTTH